MNIHVIKHLSDVYTTEQLLQAEDDVLNERPLQIEIEGSDAGEQLTHILAAVFCILEMKKSGIAINQAIRLYSQRVRDSIG